MSPSRPRQQFVPARPRSEILTAVAVGVAIVGGTVLLIWLMRPGASGVAGSGGLFNRQPRMTVLVVLTAAALGGLVLWVRRGRRRLKRLGERGTIVVGSAAVIVVAVVGGIFWPDGVVRHWPKAPKLTNPPVTNPASVPSTTTATSTGPTTTARTGTTVTSPPTTVSPATKPPVASSSTTPTTKGR
jgi:hypothetical protein